MTRGFRDRDFLETKEGFFFCVVDGIHPSDRVIAYLKYIPDRDGKWGRDARRFKRVLRNYTIPNLSETLSFLEQEYPEYLFYSKPFQVRMSGVPAGRIQRHLLPEVRLQNLLKGNALDSLEEKLVSLVELLSQRSGVKKKAFGVTGSILLNIHQTQFSDLDLLIYGRRNSLQVKRTLLSMHEETPSKVRKLSGDQKADWCKSKVELYSLTCEEAIQFFRRKWNRGIFQSTLFSVHPVLVESEHLEKYGNRRFTPLGFAEITAQVSSNTEAMFLPSTYKVEHVRILKGPKVKDLTELCSYQGIYSDLLEVGEQLEAWGKLENVIDRRNGKVYHRLLIGGPEAGGRDYVKPVD